MYEKFKELMKTDFRLENLHTISNTVTPPVPFVCSHNCVLHDRFFYIVKGKIIFDSNTKKEQSFSAGDIVYLPYDITYTSMWDTAESGEYISVNFMMFDEENRLLSIADRITLLIHDSSKKYFDLFNEIHKVWSFGSLGYGIKSKSLFYNLCFQLTADFESKSLKKQHSGIYKTILFLENNYMSDISTGELARMCGLKECMFRRLFKKIKGMSPVKYRNMLRVKKAHEMLSSGEFTVIEAAIVTNLNDASFFNREFKKHYGINPSECIPK